MATFSRALNELVTCPYDPVHRVLQSRLQMHITKCKLNHPEMDLVPCYFNAEHFVKKTELKHHLTTCKDRVVVEKKYSQSADADHPLKYTGEQSVSYASHQPSECWDDEISSKPVPGYVPPQVLRKDGFLQDLGMMKRAERKKVYNSLATLATDPQEEKEKPGVKKNDASIMRQPKGSVEDVIIKELPQYGLGRGKTRTETRIAANIFGGCEGNTSDVAKNIVTYNEQFPSLG